jgi:hypothetical protein
MKRTIVIGTLLLAMTGIAMSAIVDNYIFLPIAYKQPTPTSTQELPPTEDPYPYGVQYLSNSDVYSSGIMHVVGV